MTWLVSAESPLLTQFGGGGLGGGPGLASSLALVGVLGLKASKALSKSLLFKIGD